MPWMVYFEALFETGFCGPEYLQNLFAWRDADKRRSVAVLWLRVSPDLAQKKFLEASILVGKLGYAETQLLSMLWFERVGKYFGFKVPKSLDRVVCSQAVAQILAPEIDLRDSVHTQFDEVTPGSAYDAVLRYLASKGNP